MHGRTLNISGPTLGILGAVLAGFGAFSPFHRAPGFGSSSLIASSPFSGGLLLLCAVAGGYYAYNGKHWKVFLISFLSIALAVFGLMSYFGMLESLQSSATDLHLGWLGRRYAEHVSLSWGVLVIFVGSGVMFKGAGKMRREAKALKRAVIAKPALEIVEEQRKKLDSRRI